MARSTELSPAKDCRIASFVFKALLRGKVNFERSCIRVGVVGIYVKAPPCAYYSIQPTAMATVINQVQPLLFLPLRPNINYFPLTIDQDLFFPAAVIKFTANKVVELGECQSRRSCGCAKPWVCISYKS